ncbi:YIEGIA family protein [Metabacillus herbersteinensis]|uniref:YIEGIA family protein n=1 Tax=Metabacillus herbersteinensis TaxID=283816 RepID=A0ABV6GF93_9BACI
MNEFTYPVLFGVIMGVITRLYMLRTDYRQYPTYLHGKIIHIALGVIAAGLGTIAVPAIMEEEFTAITFLTLAASQFRDVRNMERNTLTELDGYELVPRGSTYIEGIAIAFESRNYLVIFTSLLTTFAFLVFNFWAALIVGIGCIFISKMLMAGSRLKNIADIEFVKPHFEGPGLYVGNIYIMNIGLPAKQELILKYGMGFILTPKNINAKATIANLGQRQAILHDVSTALGVVRDTGEPSLVPLAKRDLNDGRLGVFVLPQDHDIDKAIQVVGEVPTLENAIRMPSEAKANRRGGGK